MDDLSGDVERGETDEGYRGVPYDRIVASRSSGNVLYVYTHAETSIAVPAKLKFTLDTPIDASSAAERIQNGVRRAAEAQHRPRRLLLVVNPASGDGQSRQLVNKILRPFFEKLAGTQLTIVETKEGFREDGLRDALRRGDIDGCVAVGGDGVFGYLVNTVLDVFGSFPPSICLAHVAAGSTDAVASTIAARSPFASAVCVALGRRSHIDYLEVTAVSGGAETTRAAVCISTAGFMADVISMSEQPFYRRLGPLRNDVAGCIALVRNRSHACDIRFVESTAHGGIPAADCSGAGCEHCLKTPTTASRGQWKSLRGEYLSVMILNHACKSDKTPRGMNHRVHMADGAAFLVCVKSCGILRYLLFLLSMSLFGLRKHDRQIVEIIPVVDVEVRGPSAFNVDGELVTAKDSLRVTVKHKGLPVFAK